MYRYLLIISFIISVVLAGCELISPEGNEEVKREMIEELERRRDLWESQEIDAYKFTYSQQVGDINIDSISVFVGSGEVDSIQSSGSIDREDMLISTIDSFFSLIEERIKSDNVAQYTASFDEERGHPTEFEAFFEDQPREGVITIGVTSID